MATKSGWTNRDTPRIEQGWIDTLCVVIRTVSEQVNLVITGGVGRWCSG